MYKIISVLFIFSTGTIISAQNNDKATRFKVGLLIGQARQKDYPFTGGDFKYSATSYRFQLEYPIFLRSKRKFALLMEPSYYKVDHQLLNLFFIEDDEADFEDRRARFLAPRTFREYTLNIGLKMYQPLLDYWQLYLLGSTGPMYATQTTERLKRGLAFANVIALGTEIHLSDSWSIDARAGIRHTSNAGTRRPNSGHNSLSLEVGINYRFM